MNLMLGTDSPTYVLGETMTIFGTPLYTTGLEASTGTFTATVSSGSRIIGVVPLSLNPVGGSGRVDSLFLNLIPRDFTPFRSQEMTAAAARGTAETVVRVAPFSLVGCPCNPQP